MSAVAAHLIVRGVVQGVGFRYFVYRQAALLGLTGWTRNRPDGTVEIAAEGSRAQLEGLIKEVRVGPRSARVSDVQVDWREATGNYQTFDIRG